MERHPRRRLSWDRLRETHVPQPAVLHLHRPGIRGDEALLRRRIDEPPAGPDEVVTDDFGLLLQTFLEKQLALDDDVSRGQLCPQRAPTSDQVEHARLL